MKKTTKTTLLIGIFILLLVRVEAQNNYSFNFQGELVNLPENATSFQTDQIENNQKINNGYFLWLQFNETPSLTNQNQLKDNGIKLINYIANKTYLAFVPQNISQEFLISKGLRSATLVEPKFKLERNLREGIIEDWAQEGDNILVTLQFHDIVTIDYVIQDLQQKQISVVQQWRGSQNINLSIPNNCLEELASIPYVKWIEMIHAPSVKEDIQGRSIHRSNGLDTQTSAGRNYTGEGIGVLIRDDGIVGPHIDFQGRIDNSLTSGTGENHGDGVAGIMTGAGNLDPRVRGMAPGADIHIVDYVPDHLDGATQSLINSGTVQITNSSYGNGCNAGYTTISQTVDEQVINIPSLLHVFSTGNSNNNDCGYGAGNQWGNITGGHKQGKNVIATANVFFDGELVNSSSRGPAYDGRIKPDITAYGQGQVSTDENNNYQTFGGTSAASPGIAGVSAQLYELYATMNGGEHPNSALIKAALLNTANDAGNVGPDFRFGWGIVNGLRAGMLLEDERYLSNVISQGQENTHTISIPDGTVEVRFMLYWKDIEAAAGAPSALVNDLDLVVSDTENNELLPWILDPTPDPSTLDTPAITGEDHLNNMEQVLIDNPTAGDYTINVSGFDIPVGEQEYFIVYEIITDNIVVTYPNSGESFVPGEQDVIHWDAINTTESFTIEYSNDNGNTWMNAGTVAANENNFLWTIPNDITGNGLIRVTSGTFSDQSDDNFSIAPLVTGIEITSVCPDEATFSWDPIDGAEEYNLYILGEKYMEVAGSSSTNSISIPISSPTDVMWYAVTASNTTLGWTGRRSIAQFYPSEDLFNCEIANDLEVVSFNIEDVDPNNCTLSDALITATIRNNGNSNQTTFNIGYQPEGQQSNIEVFNGIIETGETIEYEFENQLNISENGTFNIEVFIDLANDEFINNDSHITEITAQVTSLSIPITESFDSTGFPADLWVIENPDNAITWIQINDVTGSDGTDTTVGYIDNFAYSDPGQEDIITTSIYELEEDSFLSFDIAKAQFSGSFSDRLLIEISTDCGSTFSTIYDLDGLDLATVGNVNSFWIPTSENDWRTEQIDLEAFTGQAIFRIVNVTGFGNSTFIDNFNIDNTLSVEGQNLSPEISIFPNPTSSQTTIVLPNELRENTTLELLNVNGQNIKTINNLNTSQDLTLDLSGYASGVYFVNINTRSGLNYVKKLMVL